MPAAYAGLFGPDDFYSCVLDHMPGVQGDPAAAGIAQDCDEQFPQRYRYNARTGMFAAYDTTRACFTDKAKDIRSLVGTAMILEACTRLYGTQGH